MQHLRITKSRSTRHIRSGPPSLIGSGEQCDAIRESFQSSNWRKAVVTIDHGTPRRLLIYTVGKLRELHQEKQAEPPSCQLSPRLQKTTSVIRPSKSDKGRDRRRPRYFRQYKGRDRRRPRYFRQYKPEHQEHQEHRSTIHPELITRGQRS